MSFELFDGLDPPTEEVLADGAVLLRGHTLASAPQLLAEMRAVTEQAPWRHLVTPGGFTMSVAMSNCGRQGWVSDRHGYRYSACDPLSGLPWPAMPALFAQLAREAAARAGYADFDPDACLINRYAVGAKLSLHQDKDERALGQPIVSVSLGLPAVFLFGTDRRTDRPRKHRLQHGDVVVWGGPSRLAFHGIEPLPLGDHLLTGRFRYNLTFRKV
ncbi:DNA oxidative demethylase AlkB [Chitinimonas arctica]|uniref:DNA oxidative demethylase AlkB n=1 Tax=Chitinimonas arctica TaxID=2594795 RepID=A0A516SFP5_9NEIS|nr:DNA oxidative demethylase AlkB [Chitinimonas arctica]QDQ26984.1 DNA oxidative demethylase AlkB [Chitinimonas arctica]